MARIAQSRTINNPSVGKACIAIMDQDRSNARVVSQYLSILGYQVEHIQDSHILFERIQAGSVDVLIMDVNKHNRGFELIPAIKDIDRLLPIIIISGDDSIEVAVRVREQGIFYFMMKPLDIEEIRLVIENALEHRHTQGSKNLDHARVPTATTMGTEELVDARQASAFLKISARRLQQLSRQGRIPAVKISRQWYYVKKQLEQWLRITAIADQRNLRAVAFDVLDDGIAVINRKLRIQTCNYAYERLTACAGDHIPGQYCYSVNRKSRIPCPESTCPVRQAFNTLKTARSLYVDHDTHGHKRYYDAIALPVKRSNGTAAYVVEVLRDSTALYDTTRHLNWIMNFFVHECKGTLGPVMLNISALADSQLASKIGPETRHSMLLSSLCSIKFLHDMIRNYIVSYNAEYGYLKCTRRVISLKKDIIEPCLSEFQAVLNKRRMSITTTIDDACRVCGDPDLLKIAIGNLVNNAIKYGTEGSTITCQVKKNHDGVEIQISNEGIGIEPDALSSVFERFIRFDKVGVSGTGLGLHIVKKIVEQHGGSVQAGAGYIIDGEYVLYRDAPGGRSHKKQEYKKFAVITMKLPRCVP
ncbi:response regulator [candidate division WOR-3 bacterium]|nr:response regulator [candidate division WOR-3 bacterium]